MIVSFVIIGPTSFAPIVEMAMTIVDQSSGQCHVLLIIADGQEWTLYEILRYALQHNWTAYEEALKTNPLLAKMVINGVVYSLGGLDCAKHFGCG
ncbi:uncharacterized protein LOC122091219 isoform X3 [Macadamia integrifolia]|uniref:uncharacterized protein LOC122091219 isoform X3 n=1 Tax=Macadamia integrifolia TaxID=60698 RepID=UPI001C4F12A7|nr:uncharacterized protein LOC122091219 isoform X3 [Macadamia integrifolia]